MECPYCKKEMKPGWIQTSNYALRFHPGEEPFKGCMPVGEVLGSGGYLRGNPKLKCQRCYDCNKIIIDLENKEK